MEGIQSQMIHLAAPVRLRTPEGAWMRPRPAIVDPGSPYCLVPYSAWSAASMAPLGQITIALDDGTHLSPPATIRAFLMPDDSEPFLLGFEGFLTHFALYCNYRDNVAYLELPA